MPAEQHLRDAKLADALDALQKRVRSDPADAKNRVFLFQLLCVLGQWERAATQLQVANELDASTILMAQVYARAIDAEATRARVFRGETTPELIGKPDEWLAWLLESLRLSAQGHLEAAAELRTKAFADAPTNSGEINGQQFEWIADADSRIGPCLELIVEGKYFWAPIANVRSLRMDQPTDLRDTVWTACVVTWTNGGQVSALIPTRYPMTESNADDALRMARRTEWTPLAEDAYAGLGQRMFVTNEGEYALFDVREISFAANGPQ